MNWDNQRHRTCAGRLRSKRVPGFALWLLLVALLLTACTTEVGTEAVVTPGLVTTPMSPVPTSLPDNATTAARIRARGYLLVGIRYDLQPFGYITNEGEVAGFDVDLGRELARRWLGDAGAVQFRQVRSDTAIEHLQAGDVDIVIAAFTHTQDWEAGADFSLPYFVDGQALLVRAADAAAVGGLMGLEGRTVGAVAWDEAADVLEAAVPFTLTLQPYDRFDAAVAALGRGEVDGVADLRRRLFWGQRILPETAIIGQYTSSPVALAFSQDDPFFADLVNLTFQEMVSDGTYAELYSRWFAPELPPTPERWPGDEVLSLADGPAVASIPDTITAIQSRGRLAVALVADRFPFAYVDAAGSLAGYEVSLVRLMAERWLGDPTAVDFIPVPAEMGREMLLTGQADLLMGALVHTRAAELELDFSLTTYVAGEGLLVWDETPVTDIVNLNGQQVAVVEGSGSREALLAAAQDASISLTVLPRPTLEAAIALLEEGRVVAVAGERIALLGPAYATSGLGVLPLRITQLPLALGLPPGDSAFRDLVNLTLQAMKAEEQFDALYYTWFDDAPPDLEIWAGAPYRTLRLEVSASEEGGD
ncbi:MAG: transporter substrate-binding domain-containing protein [Chloroflexota bacterium]|nr:transporter substrate-binding domain-containing protein [Chloroflexota bacterium]